MSGAVPRPFGGKPRRDRLELVMNRSVEIEGTKKLLDLFGPELHE